jgi:predicted TIM-barrel fold metal-dependent hydrolase
MPFPSDVAAFDTMLGVPSNRDSWQRDFGNLVRDKASSDLKHPGGYMFKELPEVDPSASYPDFLIGEMDKFNIEFGLLPVSLADGDMGHAAVAAHPKRLFGSILVDPNRGIEAIRDLKRAVREFGVIAAACFPCGLNPQVAINDKKMYPVYAACVELDIPIFINAGVPGPRFPMYPQKVELIDEVMYDFPELTFVTRHGCEPWTDLAIKLMLKWPGLHYSTSAFAPKHYPQDIVRYANTRGAEKIIYAGYYPSGLTLERIFRELPAVGFKDEVWPKFLRENALRVLRLGDRG